MWGNILTEVSYMQNFNMGFSNNKSDVLIHLTQWQYWWWFWFSFLWALYYLLVARVFRYRTLKFNPRIATTLRPHGKWGDFLTCLIPVTWCLNILINSNFILKLIEWQSESSLFTLRVRAKQWYWIYKLDLRNISDIFSTPRNVGRNKWQFATFGDLQTAEDYLHIMQMRAYSSWSKDFWSELGKKSNKRNKFNISSPVDVYKSEFNANIELTQLNSILSKKNLTSNYEKLSNNNITDNKFNNNLILVNGFEFANILLQKDQNSFLKDSSVNFFKKDFFFIDLFEDKLLNQMSLKKQQPVLNEDKKIPKYQSLDLTKLYSTNISDSFSNFFKKDILDNYNSSKPIIQHPDLDD